MIEELLMFGDAPHLVNALDGISEFHLGRQMNEKDNLIRF